MTCIIVQWATILSPIIAVVLAWWTCRSSAKESAKQISALKRIAVLQIETSLLEMEYEFFKAETSMKEYKDEIDDLQRELQRLSHNPNTTEQERSEFKRKIEIRMEDSNRQYAWWMRLFHSQANLTFAKQRIIENER
jgi:predicted RNase H-like nuclease (RuvC/YqgF family)